MFRRKNYLGETRKIEILRRLEAVEGHIQDLEERFQEDKRTHLQEFHHGEAGYVKVPEE
jgi:hypothetical protein